MADRLIRDALIALRHAQAEPNWIDIDPPDAAAPQEAV